MTRSIPAPPGCDVSPLQGYPQLLVIGMHLCFWVEEWKNTSKVNMSFLLIKHPNIKFPTLPQHVLSFIWLAEHTGKMKQILNHGWLPAQSRWTYLAHSEVAVTCTPLFTLNPYYNNKSWPINPLLAKCLVH